MNEKRKLILTYSKDLMQKKNKFLLKYEQFKDELKKTTIDLLKTAPCDCVCIIDSDGDFESLNRDVSKLSNESNIEKYLNN